jgi:hypothetical protein
LLFRQHEHVRVFNRPHRHLSHPHIVSEEALSPVSE